MIGFFLNIIASILTWLLQPIMYLIGCIVALSKGEFNQYNQHLAISKDKYGNVLCQYVFNWLLIVKDSLVKFGSHNQTISYVLGFNKKISKLTKIGVFLGKVLNKLDKNHLEKSININ